MTHKLGLLLLGNESASGEMVVSGQQLDTAFQQYTHLLGASPAALQRDWKTGQTVLQALNGLQGEDEMRVYSGIQTREGTELYLEIVRELSKGNTHKVTAKAVAIEWNARVESMLSAAQGESAKDHIRREFGFKGTKDAQRHADRLTLRVEQLDHAQAICGSIGSGGLIDLCSSIRELSVPVAEVQPVTEMPSSVQRGVSGPAAVVMPRSALGPTSKRDQPETTSMSEEETKKNCYLCSLNGRSPAECCIEVQPGSKQYLNEHDRKQKEVTCKWFDTKFPEGDPERKTKKAEARRVRELELQKLRRRKKSKAKPSSSATGETS